jgi:hypothetical protein
MSKASFNFSLQQQLCSGAGAEDGDDHRRRKDTPTPRQGSPTPTPNIFDWTTRRHRRIAAELRILVAWLQIRVLGFEGNDPTITKEERDSLEAAKEDARKTHQSLLLDAAFVKLGRNLPEDWRQRTREEGHLTRAIFQAHVFEVLKDRYLLQAENLSQFDSVGMNPLNTSTLATVHEEQSTMSTPNDFEVDNWTDDVDIDITCVCDPPCDFMGYSPPCDHEIKCDWLGSNGGQ